MRELSQPTILDRRVREDWESRGATDLAQRARAGALDLLESHQPAPIDADVAAQVLGIIEAADHERGVT
jgi:trimethylamine:corrinoid methyltransferase-like protein